MAYKLISVPLMFATHQSSLHSLCQLCRLHHRQTYAHYRAICSNCWALLLITWTAQQPMPARLTQIEHTSLRTPRITVAHCASAPASLCTSWLEITPSVTTPTKALGAVSAVQAASEAEGPHCRAISNPSRTSVLPIWHRVALTHLGSFGVFLKVSSTVSDSDAACTAEQQLKQVFVS